MSDTHIHYKYKDGLHDDIKTGMIICDRGVFKSYLRLYDDDNNPLLHSFKHCNLIARGNEQAQSFLLDIVNHWNSNKSGYQWEYEDKGKVWFEFLKSQELVELEFCCY